MGMNFLKKGDSVKVITGKDKGKTGEVAKVFPSQQKVLIEGLNVAKKHKKKTQESAGAIVDISLPINWSNLVPVNKKEKGGTKSTKAKKTGRVDKKEKVNGSK